MQRTVDRNPGGFSPRTDESGNRSGSPTSHRQTRHRQFVFIAFVCAGSLWLAGCCRMDTHGHVYREWSRRMSEMGIFPVYPPREDVVVGDVYALPLHPYDTAAIGYIGGLGNAGIHVEYLGDQNLGWTNFLTKLERYYRTRPYPADSATAIVGASNAPFTRMSGFADETNRTSAFSPGSTNRLRQVSFPDFTVTRIDQQSLSAVVPIEGIMASLNFNHTATSRRCISAFPTRRATA